MSEFFFTLTKKNLSCNNNSKNYCLFRCIVSVKMRYFPKEVGFNPIGSSSMTSKVKNGSIKGSFCCFKLPTTVNLLSHCEQLKGSSPAWIFCVVSYPQSVRISCHIVRNWIAIHQRGFFHVLSSHCQVQISSHTLCS